MILLAFFQIYKSHGQQITKELRGKDTVAVMPISIYRLCRERLMIAEAMEKQCDSIRVSAINIFNTKDSITMAQNHKLAIKDTMLSEKNKTIQLLSSLQKDEKPHKLTVSLIIISVAEFFLLILAIK